MPATLPNAERRVYRLAVLLTGNPAVAALVLGQVIDRPRRRAGLRALDPAHLDRLAVLRCREHPVGSFRDVIPDPASAAALAALQFQMREAWMFTHVDDLPARDAARAMDCSVTALGVHLQRADAAIAAAIGDQQARALAQQLKSSAISLRIPEVVIRARIRQLAMRTAVRWLIIVAIVLAVLALLAWSARRWLP